MPKSLDPSGLAGPKVRIILLDSTTGAGKTALTNSSSGLNIAVIADNEAATTAYTAAGSTVDPVTTLGTWAAPTSGHCRFKELDATNHPGVYELQFEASRWAVSGARKLIGTVKVTGAVAQNFEVQLTGMDLGVGIDIQTIKGQSITCSAPVAVGPNVGTAQPINFTGTSTSALVKTDVIDINSSPAVGVGGTAQGGSATGVELSASDPYGAAILTNWTVEMTSGPSAGQSFVVTSQSGTSSTRTLSNTGITLSPAPVSGDGYIIHPPTNATFSLGTHAPDNWIQSTTFVTDAIGAAAVSAAAVTKIQTGLATPTNITGGTITTVTTLTNLPAIPTDWLTAAGVKADAVTKIQNGLATPTNITGGTITTVTNLTNAPTNGDLNATMKASVTAAVWDAARSGHTTSGTFGFYLDAAISSVSGGGGGGALPSNGLDSILIETGLNARQALSLIAAASAGAVSGAGTGTITIKGAGVSTTRIVGSTDSSGNRTAITATPPA